MGSCSEKPGELTLLSDSVYKGCMRKSSLREMQRRQDTKEELRFLLEKAKVTIRLFADCKEKQKNVFYD